jgi:hypothetical protein
LHNDPPLNNIVAIIARWSENVFQNLGEKYRIYGIMQLKNGENTLRPAGLHCRRGRDFFQ